MRAFPPSINEPGIGTVRLYPLNPGEFDGLKNQNSESAQFGLTVAFLMARAQCLPRVVMATGAIGMPDAFSPVQILPVHHIREKLRAFMAHHQSRGASAPPGVVLLPTRDPDGAAVSERYRDQIAEIEAAGSSVVTASTLKEVIDKLGLRRAWLTPQQRRKQILSRALIGLAAVTATAALLVAGSFAHERWQARSLPLEFSTTLDRRQTLMRFPVQTVSSEPDTTQRSLIALCDGAPPGVMIGRWLGIGARAMNSESPGAWAVIAVSPGQLKIQHEGLSIDPNGVVSGAVQIVGKPEPMLVGLLAWRQKNPDIAMLESRIRDALARVSPEEWIARARNLIPQLVPGVVMTVVQTLPAGSACTDQ